MTKKILYANNFNDDISEGFALNSENFKKLIILDF